MAEFLDFNEISQRIPFANVLDYLNIPYTTKGKELRGEGFIVDTVKNLYFNPKGDDKGSVINFFQARKVAFKIIDHHNNHVGYVGLKDGKWFYPKGFKRDTLYKLFRQQKESAIV